MNNEVLILDLRKIEKRNIFIKVTFLLTYLFLGNYLGLRNESWIPFIYFLVIDPAIKFLGVSCPNCNQKFHQQVYFFTKINKEKERTNCISCNYSPKIYSDYLETDCLSNELKIPIIDLRPIEKKIIFTFFTALVFTFIGGMIAYIVLKSSVQFEFANLAYGLIAFYLIGCYLSISREYKKAPCSKCNNKFFNGLFGFLKARKLISESKCAQCNEYCFIRSYISTTKPIE